MPGLANKNAQFGNASLSCIGSVSNNAIWSKNRSGNLTFDQLQKFWSELSPEGRQELLRIDKQTFFEQARKNLYCSRCNGLLLEAFSQIVMYGRSLLQEGSGHLPGKMGTSRNQIDNGSDIMSSRCRDDVQDPSVHPWGGLAVTRDGTLTLLDCFVDETSLKALQKVFDSARARERERELLYPDACGGGGRGWISQGMANYGRGHGTRETCALHTARLSCDTLVDFWSALGDETRQSLLRMKEEDFIERLIYRFDSKRFCRDCRRNVIREFKELKELKRMRKEPRCTNWFCVPDTAFQYEVSEDTVQADWHQSFTDTDGTYHHFEWAIGTGEGKSDILEFEDIGMNGGVEVSGLDLGGVTSCFITLRAWKLDGRCTELTVKAHALKGQPCVHRRLIVGDGFVTITKGDSIRRFFEHAEETEEEEDDDSIDKDGNEIDGDGSRPQKHAKSPELAREFLLDAATVIFKEQVEKAFREGTARQNAHSIFVCLALKLLEERVHVACKEIITLEKQIKLLEEEEKEKREDEERKERRRAREREKKLRRKERLKGKEREKDQKCVEQKQLLVDMQISPEELPSSPSEETHNTSHSSDSVSVSEVVMEANSLSSDIIDEQSSNESISSKTETPKDDVLRHSFTFNGGINSRDDISSFNFEQLKSSRRKLRFRKDSPLDQGSRWCDRRRPMGGNDGGAYVEECDVKMNGYRGASARCVNGHRQSRSNTMKSNAANCSPKYGEKFHCSNNRIQDGYDLNSCGCNPIRMGRDFRTVNSVDSPLDRPFYRSSKYNHGCYAPDGYGIPKGKLVTVNMPLSKDVLHAKKVWEPMETRKKCPRSNSDSYVTLKSSNCTIDACDGHENGYQQTHDSRKSFDRQCLSEISGNSGQCDDSNSYRSHTNGTETSSNSLPMMQNDFVFPTNDSTDPSMSTSSSDNCSSCLSEGDSCTGSSGVQNAESLSTSDSEDASLHSEGRASENVLQDCADTRADEKHMINEQESLSSGMVNQFPPSPNISHFSVGLPSQDVCNSDYGGDSMDVCQQRHALPGHNQSMHLPVFPTPSTMGYYHQPAASWAAAPTNGLVTFPQNHYLYTGPLSYGLSTNQSSNFCMQYGGIQSLTTPALGVGQFPSYHALNKANVGSPKDQTKASKLGEAHEGVCVPNVERPFTSRQLPQKEPSPKNGGSLVNPLKSHNENSTFSLFHFGGPVAAVECYGSNGISVNSGVVADFSPKSPVAPVRSDVDCSNKETTIEEYSLFAASGGARFSFF